MGASTYEVAPVSEKVVHVDQPILIAEDEGTE
jgi:hypothetical protein